MASFVQREVCELTHVAMCIDSLFLFTDSSIPLYGHATICLSIHLSVGMFLEFTVTAYLDTGNAVLSEVQ